MIDPSSNIAWAAGRFSNREAVVDGERRFSFRDLHLRSNRLANALLAHGLEAAGRVAKLMDNCAEILEVNFATAKAGGASLSLHARNSIKEHIFMLENSEAEFLFVDEGHLEQIPSILEQCSHLRHIIGIGRQEKNAHRYEDWVSQGSPNRTGVKVPLDSLYHLHYTSGTSGTPKAVVNTHRIHQSWLSKFFRNMDYRFGAEDSMLHAGPMTHASFNFTETTYLRGARNIILPRFDPDLLIDLIEVEQATTAYLVSTMIPRLLDSDRLNGADVSSLHTITYGAAPISEENLGRAIERLGPICRQTYGLTEARQPITILQPWEHTYEKSREGRCRLASCGKPAAGVKLALYDLEDRAVESGTVGEICLRGDYVMDSYWKNPKATAETIRGGWVHTGDLAVADEEGFLYIIDRKKEMIITGGFNVYPSEVERVLCHHPAVLEALVFGVPDNEWGEAIKALIVPRPGESPDPSDIIEFTKNEIASFKKPKHIEFMAELPKNSQGKIIRRDIRDKYWEGQSRRVN